MTISEWRMETPNTKLQTPDNVQSSSSKAPTSREKSGCGDWEIFGVWCLNIGIWNFICSTLQRFNASTLQRFNASTLRRLARVPGIAQTVAEEIEGEQRGCQCEGGKDNHPPIDADGVDLRGAFGEERTEACLGRLDAESEVTQKRFIQQNRRDRQRQIGDNDAANVGQNVA